MPSSGNSDLKSPQVSTDRADESRLVNEGVPNSTTGIDDVLGIGEQAVGRDGSAQTYIELLDSVEFAKILQMGGAHTHLWAEHILFEGMRERHFLLLGGQSAALRGRCTPGTASSAVGHRMRQCDGTSSGVGSLHRSIRSPSIRRHRPWSESTDLLLHSRLYTLRDGNSSLKRASESARGVMFRSVILAKPQSHRSASASLAPSAAKAAAKLRRIQAITRGRETT